MLNPSKHTDLWEKIYDRRSQSLLFEGRHYLHENVKIAPSTQPIKTDRGWLIIYAGAGDRYIIVLSCDLDNLVNYLWRYCKYAGGI